MLLAVDIGNTNIFFGVFAGAERAADFRLLTDARRPADEYGALLWAALAAQGATPSGITAVVVSSVVPALTTPLCAVFRRLFAAKPLVITGETDTGLVNRYGTPGTLGADRWVNAFAARELYGENGTKHCIVVDMGTATKIEAVTAGGVYLGGAILPGVGISMDGLFLKAAQLARVELTRPHEAIATNTADALRSGILYGYADLVDGMVGRFWSEMVAGMEEGAADDSVRIIGTGGHVSLIAPQSATIDTVDEQLTLTGLRLLHERLASSRERDL
jgi:type III pantothenate kinase